MTRNLTFFGKILPFFLIFISCMSFAYSEYEVTKLPGKRFTTESEIKEYLEKTDVTVLAFFYKKESDKSNEIAKNLKVVYSKLQYLIEFILIDCDKSHMEECRQSDDDMEDEYYRIEMYVPPQYKYNPYTKELNQHQKLQYAKTDVSDKALYKFLTKIIISREQKVTNENYENFKLRADLNKVLLFTNKKNTPLMFRGLSGYFYDRLHFGVVQDTEKALCEKLNIKDFPTLMVIQTIEDGVIVDEPIEITYKGELDVEHIVKFLNKYALEEKLYLTRKKNPVEDEKNLIYFFKLSAEKAMNFFTSKKDKEIIFYFDNNVKNGKITYDNLSPDIKEFNAETHGFFLFGYVDCTGEEKEKICRSSFKNKEFPNMVLYRPAKEVKERISKGIELPMEIENIRREINILFEPNVKTSNPMNFQIMLTESVTNKKISLLYLFDGNIGLGFSLLTQKPMFKDLFDFIVMDNPPAEIKKNLQCNHLPYISIVVPDDTRTDKNGNPEMRLMVYTGKYSYSGLNSFLTSSFQINDKNSDESASTSSREDNKPTEITFIQSTDDLVKTCSKKKLCVIGFFDMRPNEESKKKYEESFEIFKNFTEASKKRPTSFGYINATCQEEFTSKFGVNLESLPSAIIYSYAKEVYSNLVGTFSVEDLSELISKTVSGRMNFQRMQKDNAVLQDIKCETIQPYVSNDDDDDDIMKELLAEERKKREEFDKERNADDDDKKKKKKKKKKHKKKDKSTDL